MTLQAKLTLGSVVLASLMVGLVSAVELGNEIERQFAETLERATAQQAQVTSLVGQTLNRQRTLGVEDALSDPELQRNLINTIAYSHAILEIAVLNPQYRILLDTDKERIGATSPPYPDFRPIVTMASWYQKLRVLLERGTHYYQLPESKLGPSEKEPILLVRVVIEPALIRNDIGPGLQRNAVVALLSVIGAVIVTFLFSAVAFRPLGRIGRMLDLAAKGEYETETEPPPAKTSRDEFSVMASKVSLLGQRLRGAQFEVSDLRGNIDRLLEDLEDAVFIFDRELRLVFASGTVEKFLGTGRANLAGKTLGAVFPPYTTLGLVIGQTAQNGQPARNRRVPLPPRPEATGGPGTVLLSVDKLQNPAVTAGAGLLIRLRDPEAERKLGRELQMADRLAALSRISGGVAHEVKNPLNAILLHVEVARAKLAHGDTDVEQQMEIVSREILRLDRVVKTFLDFTRPVELNFTNVPLKELVAEIVDLARPQAESSNIQVRVHQNADSGEVRVDRDLLKQAFLNVVVNAIQAMPGGGDLQFESSSDGEMAEIRIADTGPGIDSGLRDKIFRLYFTTKKEGSGIGLAMTFRIIQLHDGTIDFTSEPGKGTTFSIRLPMAV